jgi:hypothetical protein
MNLASAQPFKYPPESFISRQKKTNPMDKINNKTTIDKITDNERVNKGASFVSNLLNPKSKN